MTTPPFRFAPPAPPTSAGSATSTRIAFTSIAGRGIFMVVDGVGGQAAGGRAADTALEMIRARLASGNGPIADRVREAITIANNEVHRQAAARAEWHGMACVLTVAALDGERAVIGHVGDTRLYKLRAGTMQKITPDHSPVGEREDAGELSELDAMRHPRRNEVYRDVGSEPHETGDADFVEIQDIDVGAGRRAAPLQRRPDGSGPRSDAIQRHRRAHAGQPDQVARALVNAANDAGGKDNVTVVYVEGERFRRGRRRERRSSGRLLRHAVVWLLAAGGAGVRVALGRLPHAGRRRRPVARIVGASVIRRAGRRVDCRGAWPRPTPGRHDPGRTGRVPRASHAQGRCPPDQPGAARRDSAPAGRRRLMRMPAVTVVDVANAELAGFRIVGDAATPLGIGVLTRSASVRLFDLEITGAARTAIDLGAGQDVMLLASDIHDNPGAGLALRAGGVMRIAHSTFRPQRILRTSRRRAGDRAGRRPTFLRQRLSQPRSARRWRFSTPRRSRS